MLNNVSNIYRETLNPGNIRYVETYTWIGQCGQFKGFTKFLDQIYGIRALVVLLHNYLKKGVDTLELIIGRYAPSTENNTREYIKYVREYLAERGFFPLVFKYDTPAFMYLVMAICKYETGYELTHNEFNYVIQRFDL